MRRKNNSDPVEIRDCFLFPIPQKKIAISLIIASLLLVTCAAAYATAVYLKQFTFDEDGSLDKWGTMVLNGRVDYDHLKLGDDGYIKAFSDNACSALYYNVGYDLEEYPMLKWKWRVTKFPDTSKATTEKEKDDYAARVYVIFPFLTFTFSEFLEYVWSDHLPEGLILDSPYGKNIKIMVIRSGPSGQDAWLAESRNIYEDYRRAFGKEPRAKAGAIAIMCDADSTKSVAESYFDDISIAKE